MRIASALLAFALFACTAPKDSPPRPEEPKSIRAAPILVMPPPERAPTPAKPVEKPAWTSKHELRSNAGAYVLHFDPAPEAMPDNEPFTIEAWIALAASPGELCSDLSLTVDAAMPEHGHGMNRVPKITRAEDGHFVVEGMLFHMTGRWELYFDVTRGAVTERAQCDVKLAD
jgi:hypothetical protein